MSITDVIKYEGNNQTFIWKHPSEDFNTGSQLIVHETQEAIFFLNGQALDSFGPGRHELETQNLPLLNGISKITTGGVSPFHSEVYFVNLIEQMGIRWGTNSKIQFMEPTYGFPLSLGASGEMALAVKEPPQAPSQACWNRSFALPGQADQLFQSFPANSSKNSSGTSNYRTKTLHFRT